MNPDQFRETATRSTEAAARSHEEWLRTREVVSVVVSDADVTIDGDCNSRFEAALLHDKAHKARAVADAWAEAAEAWERAADSA